MAEVAAVGRNPIDGFHVEKKDISFVGENLRTPECVLCEKDGTLWTSNAGGGVTRILPNGSQTFIRQTAATLYGNRGPELEKSIPNGLAFAENGDILVANYGTSRFEIMRRNGETRIICDTLDCHRLGEANFIYRDSRKRLWFTIATMKPNWIDGLYPNGADGYVGLIDEKGIRVVADGFCYTNEVRLDEKEEYLYVVETGRKCISRLRVQPDGSLKNREIFGPTDLGPAGFPDGIAFDEYGNLWGTCVWSEKVFAITPEGDLLTVYEDGNPRAIAELERSFRDHTLTDEKMKKCESALTPWMTSVAFGSPDLRTVYIGSYTGGRIACFRSPVAGRPMIHWNEKNSL
jgi:gluconolactonase